MHKYILKRILYLIPVMLGVSFIVFLIMSLTPGDPVELLLGDNYTPEAAAKISKDLGLDQPFIFRYLKYVSSAFRGNLGISIHTGEPVMTEIMARLPNTIILAAAAIFLAVVVGIPLGTISAAKQYSFVDSGSMLLALVGVSMPNFWFGLMLILLFSARLNWFPPGGFDGFMYLILPAITLSANSLAIITRMTRSSMVEILRMDYVQTARAKGINRWQVIIKHALRNAMIPIVTTIGLQFGFAMGGAVLVETIFSWPGIGRLLVDAIKWKDTPIVMAVVLILALQFTLINLFVDIIYAFLDPRIRAQYKVVR